MLSNQTIQKLIQEIRRIAGLECSIWSQEGKCVAATSIKAKPDADSIAEFIAEFEHSGTRETIGKESLFLAEGDMRMFWLWTGRMREQSWPEGSASVIWKA